MNVERSKDGGQYPIRHTPYPDLLSCIIGLANTRNAPRATLIRLHPAAADQILRERQHRAWLDEYPIEVTPGIPRFPGFEIVREEPSHTPTQTVTLGTAQVGEP